MMNRRQMVLTGTAVLAGCAADPRLLGGALPAESGAALRPVYVATNRRPSADPEQGFAGLRSDMLSFASYDISVPPDRRPGEFAFPRENSDARTQFLVQKQAALEAHGMMARINADLRRLPRGKRALSIFVHGYNVSYPAAVFRTAQISEDFGLEGPIVLFSWPATGKLTHYVHDRDSALFSRGAFVEMLTMLTRSEADSIMILAHSMGTLTTMDGLAALSLMGRQRVLDRLDAVVLAQPDIDVDVFRSQVVALDLDRTALVVFGSRRDRALRVSTFIAGRHPRVGSAGNIEDLRQMGVIVVDLSNVQSIDRIGHTAFQTSPELLAIIRSGELAERIVEGAPGQDILMQGATLTGNAAMAIAYLPYVLVGDG